MLDARAMHDGPEEEVFVRVAGRGDRFYIDLGDATWRAVEADAAGWRIAPDPPVRFRRPAGMRPLPEPARAATGRSIDSRTSSTSRTASGSC